MGNIAVLIRHRERSVREAFALGGGKSVKRQRQVRHSFRGRGKRVTAGRDILQILKDEEAFINACLPQA